MASVGNSTCARFDNVARSGTHYQQEAPFLYVKGTWLPSEFTISVCDGNDAWTGRATKEFVLNKASYLAMTESEYVDSIQYYFSKQQPNARYELKWGKSSSPELLCSKIMPHELILRLETIADSGPGVAADMVQFLLDAHHRLNEELARKTRAFERELAAKDLVLASLRTQGEEEKGSPVDHMNGHANAEPDVRLEKTAGGTSSRGKRKAGASNAETGSRKRAAQAVKPSGALALYQKSSPIPPILPPPLSAMGYLPPKGGEERESSKEPSWLDKIEAKDNGVTDDSNSDEQLLPSRKAFLDRLSDVALMNEEIILLQGKKSSGKKHGKSAGKSGGKSSKKPQSKPSLEDSLDQVEDVVEKGIKSVDTIFNEVSSPLTTPVKQQRKAPATAKKQTKSSSKPKKQPSSRSRKKVKPVAVDSEPEVSDGEPSESPEPLDVPAPGTEEDRAITVQNAEFHDFDASRSEAAFEEGQFWALYDDQDGMPRFYGRVIGVQNEPFQVSVEWLEPFKPNLPANGLVKTAQLSAACGDFTFGSHCTQDLPAFSHVIQVGTDTKRAPVVFWPEKEEIWALYREWDKKQAKKEDGDEEYHYEYDLVKVQSKLSTTDGIAVVPLVKVEGFKSLFTVADEEQTYQIPYKQVQAIFSHCIPKHGMLGSESPGVPVGAWELDPASTPSEYLGTVAQEGMP
ncbi:hypothetical protein KC19_4G012300 [Ceratodon purpureus]|uniref:DUF3444 domain-containing protein n=1 Tax=Ceratodon purpureus TaxID=3225 RepID=A0A8T0I5A9_CERPU|nr:hypothetical protein KC19_4G012300 [Ceratodon purpureus]